MTTQDKSYVGQVLFVAVLGLGLVLSWLGGSEPDHGVSSRWMDLADADQDGRLSQEEYDATSDGITPMTVLDVNGDLSIDQEEIEAFMMEADPILWLRL